MQKRKTILGICLCLVLLFPTSVMAKDKSMSVNVAISNTPITVNGQIIDLSHSQFPMLIYKNTVYFPLTYSGAALLGVTSSWHAYDLMDHQLHSFFFIGRGHRIEEGIPNFNQAYPMEKANPTTASAKILDEEISVNTSLDSRQNIKEEYPLLRFRDFTYFPLNWDYAVQQFGWNLSVDPQKGLIVDSTDPIRPMLDPKVAFISSRDNPGVMNYVYNDTGYVGYPASALLSEKDYQFVYKIKGQPEKHFDLGKQLITDGFDGCYEFNSGLDQYGDICLNNSSDLSIKFSPNLDGNILTIRCVKVDESKQNIPVQDLILKIDCASEKVISQKPFQESEYIPVNEKKNEGTAYPF